MFRVVHAPRITPGLNLGAGLSGRWRVGGVEPIEGAATVPNCKPFTWTANSDTILAKVRWIESELHKLTGR